MKTTEYKYITGETQIEYLDDNGNNVHQTIFNHYGYDEQLKQLSEETGELFKALNKYRRKKVHLDLLDSLKADIVDEIADVEIMLQQFKEHFNFDTEERKVYKLKRELERIGKGENNRN